MKFQIEGKKLSIGCQDNRSDYHECLVNQWSVSAFIQCFGHKEPCLDRVVKLEDVRSRPLSRFDVLSNALEKPSLQ